MDRLSADPGTGERRAGIFEDPTTDLIAAFLLEIGLRVRAGELVEETFIPGILIHRGELIVDERRLLSPGELLHEAGHIAVTGPDLRPTLSGRIRPSSDHTGGDEMAAIAWSYAAALHLGIDPSVVFHPEGYAGESQNILDNFRQGRYFGVPMLQWLGLTVAGERAAELDTEPYPHMLKWLCTKRDGAES